MFPLLHCGYLLLFIACAFCLPVFVRFKTSNNDHMIEVMMGDLLDFKCPYYSTSTDPIYQEHYIIYQVSSRNVFIGGDRQTIRLS